MFGYLNELLLSDLASIVSDIPFDSLVKKNGFLAYDAKRGAQMMKVIVSDVNAFEVNVPLCGLVESQ